MFQSLEDDEWGWFVPPPGSTSHTVTFDLDAVKIDPMITIFSGGCDASGTQIAGVYDLVDGVTESITFSTTTDVTYRNRLQEYESGRNIN